MKRNDGKKRAPRYPVDLQGWYRSEIGGEWIECRLINLSKGGLCLRTPKPPEKESRIEIVTMSIDPDGKERKRLHRARVAWVREDQCGVEFLPTGPIGMRKAGARTIADDAREIAARKASGGKSDSSSGKKRPSLSIVPKKK